MKRAAAGDEPGAEGNDAVKGRGPPRSVADVFAGDDWMERMPEALRKQTRMMLDMYLGAGIIMTQEKFMDMASKGADHIGKTCLLTLIRSPAEEFDAVEDGVLEKISKMSPQEATNMLPHAARACCGPVLEALIRQGADLNSFNFQRGALTAGGAPFAIVAKKTRPRLLQLMLESGGADPNAIDSMGWSALHILALAASDRGGTTEDWQRTLKSDRETAEATRVRQHGDVIGGVEINVAALRTNPTHWVDLHTGY